MHAPIGNRWQLVSAYAAVCAANQMLWLTFAPVTTSAARHYGVSVAAIGWLSELFPLLYVVLAIPAGMLLDRWLRPMLALGAALTAVGGAARLIDSSYGWLLVGQVLVAIAQPLVLNAVTQVSSGYLEPSARPQGIATASMGIFAGMVVSLGLGAAMGSHLGALLVVQMLAGVLAAGWLVLALTRPAPYPPLAEKVNGRSVAGLLRDPYLARLTGLVFLGFGIFVALTTWLQPLLHPAGVSTSEAGLM
ncbi:MAG: MFS transporter, partial [Nocardioidaceae bacterium]